MAKKHQMLQNHESQLKTNTRLVLKPQMDTCKINREGGGLTLTPPHKKTSYEIITIFSIFT